jgi:hypothetical protein
MQAVRNLVAYAAFSSLLVGHAQGYLLENAPLENAPSPAPHTIDWGGRQTTTVPRDRV